MKRWSIMLIGAVLIVAACAATDDAGPKELPMADDAATGSQTQDADGAVGEPIPTEPGGGIGDGATGEELPVISPALAKEIDTALADLAQRVGDDGIIEVVAAHELTWSTSALGCPEPDRSYTEALVDGYRIELAAGNEVFNYHGAMGALPFLCDNASESGPGGGPERTPPTTSP